MMKQVLFNFARLPVRQTQKMLAFGVQYLAFRVLITNRLRAAAGA